MIVAALAIVAGLAIVGLVTTNVLWFKHLRYLTNLAVANSPTEFATLQIASKTTVSDKKTTKRIRPEGI